MRKHKILLFFCVAVLVSSCASTSYDQRCSILKSEIYSLIDTRKLVEDLVVELCAQNKLSQQNQDEEIELAVLVPDVLNVQSLRPDGIGLALGELLRSSISNVCNKNIRQIDLSKDLQLNQLGIVALTREVAKAHSNELEAATAYIVTYNEQPTKLTLVGRYIDLRSATVLRVATKEVSWNCSSSFFGQKKFNYLIN